MRGDEPRPRNAVAVKEHAIVTRADADGAVADFCKTETAVGMPRVLDRNFCIARKRRDDAAGGFIRAVIGNDNFKIAVGLRFKPAQSRRQRIGPVVRRDDDRDQICHFERPASHAFM